MAVSWKSQAVGLYNHVCACREELGRGGVGYNEIVTSLPTKQDASGQADPRYQGRALPHNLQTLAYGTSDGWIRKREGGLRPSETGFEGENFQGARVWQYGKPTVDYSTDAAPYDDTKNKLSIGDTTTQVVKLTGDDHTVTCPTIAQMSTEATTHWTDLQVQLGSATSPKQPYTNLDPNKGLVSRMWTDTVNAMGKPMGLRAGAFNLAQYCGWENENGPSADRNGSRGLMTILRILNPPNSLSNVLQLRGTLADTLNYVESTQGAPQAAANLELVVATVFDNLLTVEWAPPAEIPIKTQVSPIV
jgi:hypothetical protein